MATAHVIYEKDLRITAQHILSGDRIVTDAPPDNKGKGEAFSPTDLLATSLACCMLTIIGIAANEHGFSIDGTEASVTKVMFSNPRRVGRIEIVMTFPEVAYTLKQRRIIEAAARTCPVSQSLSKELEQDITFHFPQVHHGHKE